MNARLRVSLLIAIMSGIVLGIELLAVLLLYRTALNEESGRLMETAQSQARLIEAIARFQAAHPAGRSQDATAATLDQIQDAHRRYRGKSRTSEFTLGRREGEQIVFLLSHGHQGEQAAGPIPFKSSLGEPMRRALNGRSGIMTGRDYRGQTVLAAHEPVAELGMGIVAKIDLSEVRAPFVKAGLLAGLLGVLAVLIGAYSFYRVTNPVVRSMQENIASLQETMASVNQLSGLLPICSSCKKIRDDKGYWNQIESYISSHSDADFTHGICPECAEKLYPELRGKKKDGV